MKRSGSMMFRVAMAEGKTAGKNWRQSNGGIDAMTDLASAAPVAAKSDQKPDDRKGGRL
jgi:hypothetical protein